MKKQIKLFILMIALILILYVPVSYAMGANFEFNIKNDSEHEENELEFFTVDSKEKAIGSILNMYINLSQIDYDMSEFILTFEGISDNIDAELIQNSNGINIEKENNEFSLIINKNELNIEQIILTYTISDNFKVGDKFTLIGKISEYKEETLEDTEKKLEENNEENIKINVENAEENQKQNSENNIKEVQIEITIVENQKDEKEIENLKENQNSQENKIENFTQNVIQTTTKYNSASVTNIQTVVYNGSRNNYLGTLAVENYRLNTEFCKENTTYFLTVPNDIESIKITATSEESSSTVCIYGNEELKVGTNKVLISVTAENGDVRNYRIFVNREA